MSGAFGGPYSFWREQRKRGRWLAASITVVAIMALSLSPLVTGKKPSGRSLIKPAEASLVEPKVEPELVSILVPREDLSSAAHVSAADFMPFEIPAAHVPKDVLLLSDKEYIAGKQASSHLIAGAMVSRRDLVEEVRPVFPFDVPEGYRAVTLNVDARSAVEGHAGPGTIVDVLWVFGQCSERKVLLAAREAKVLSLAGSTSREARSPRLGHFTTTLLVREREAKALQLAAPGELALVLRGPGGGGEKNEPLNLHGAMHPRRPDGSSDVCVVKDASGGSTKYVLGENGWQVSLKEGGRR